MTDEFPFDTATVRVTQTPDELRYKFLIQGQSLWTMISKEEGCAGGCFSLFMVFGLIVFCPLWAAIIVARALATHGADQPAWIVILSGMFSIQAVGFVGLLCRTLYRRWATRGTLTEWVFSPTRGCDWNNGLECELHELRGVVVFLDPDGKSADLCFLVGDERYLRDVFGGFPADAIRKLAEDVHRRLTEFCRNVAVGVPPDSLQIVEPTEAAAWDRNRTLPSRQSLCRKLANLDYISLTETPQLLLVWCLGIAGGLAGAYPLLKVSGRASDLNFLGSVGFLHGVLLFLAWAKWKMQRERASESKTQGESASGSEPPQPGA